MPVPEKEVEVALLIRSLLALVDPDPGRPGLRDTPRRVAKMFCEELLSGYTADLEDCWSLFPLEDSAKQDLIIVRDIPLVSLCEHHMLPFRGVVHVAYVPSENYLGLSKFKRVVDVFSRRLQIQEVLTGQIADALYDRPLSPLGVMVITQAEHSCMSIRGIQTPGTLTTTSAVRGWFEEDLALRKEALDLLGF